MKNVLMNISSDYDLELKNSHKTSWEAYLSISQELRKYSIEEYMHYYKISKSINRIKRKISNLDQFHDFLMNQ